jgi:hypothetical protein
MMTLFFCVSGQTRWRFGNYRNNKVSKKYSFTLRIYTLLLSILHTQINIILNGRVVFFLQLGNNVLYLIVTNTFLN